MYMLKSTEAITNYCNKEGVSLTIVNKKGVRNAFHVVLQNPSNVKVSKPKLHSWIRKEPSDLFLMTAVTMNDKELRAVVIPKHVLSTVSQLCFKIGRELEELVTHLSSNYLDELEVNTFYDAIGEMYKIGDITEDLLYHTIAPNHDTLETLCEFQEATNFIFNTYPQHIEATTQKDYETFIDLIDRID